MHQERTRFFREEPWSGGVIGLGYVGLPLALHMSRHFETIGFDIEPGRIQALKNGLDETGEVSVAELAESDLNFTNDPTCLREARFIIVAVPTPIDEARTPNLGPLIRASETVGTQLQKGTVIVYESTVYPGVTEGVCCAALERASGLTSGHDFWLGYSPERINPGDKDHTFDRITKVVSGQTSEILELIARVYGRVVRAGVYRAPNIKTAEAAKVIENTQRDLNIALMNELAMIFHTQHIQTHEVLQAAATKWNFLPFQPGLVGGHCIGVDPYYLTYMAETSGYYPQLILAGRKINDGMAKYIAEQTIKQMIKAGIRISTAKVLVLGLTFKENVPDLRNSKVFDAIDELGDYEVEVALHDPIAPMAELAEPYRNRSVSLEPHLRVDAVIVAVKHNYYLDLGFQKLSVMMNPGATVIDVKGCFPKDEVVKAGFSYWRL